MAFRFNEIITGVYLIALILLYKDGRVNVNADCSLPQTPHNGNFEVEGCEGVLADPFYPPCWKAHYANFSIGQIVHYFCLPEFVLQGEEKIVCLSSGNWSAAFPKCCKQRNTSLIASNTLKLNENSSQNSGLNQYRKGVVSLDVYEKAAERRFIASEDTLSCSSLLRTKHVEFECLTPDGRINQCDRPPFPPYTVAHLKCAKYYKSAGELAYRYRKCKPDGTWSTEGSITCIADCGQSDPPKKALITNGITSERGQFPWHTAIYIRRRNRRELWEYICGGSLISNYVVLTAAHCVTSPSSEKSVDTSMLTVVFGKFHRTFETKEANAQQRHIQQIIVHPSYSSLNFDSDIALLILDHPVEFTFSVRPVCFPEYYNSLIEEYQIQEGNLGTVVGWGLTETGILSDDLKTAQLPVIAARTCIDSYKAFFQSRARYTNFCAGYRNGTGVCNGDSGSGMVFPSGAGHDQRWYVQGIVSVGAPDPHEKYKCNSHQYSLFTRVGRYADWIVRTLTPDGYI